MIIYLIRHAEKEKNKKNPPLTDLGKIQAQKTAEYFKSIKIDNIYSSPLKRTFETAEIISGILKNGFKTSDLLKERFNWGDLEKETYKEFLENWKKSSMVRNWQPPKGFSSVKAGQRMQKFIESIDEKKNKKVIIVSHGVIIADFLRNIFNDKTLSKIYPDFTNYYENSVSLCSMTTVEKTGSEYKIISIAETDHLK